jgi:hypothetical protein
LTILSADVIQISTQSNAVPGGGTDNIGFLVGNAGGPQRRCGPDVGDRWIETV